MKKDKAYSVRQHKKLVDRVKELTGLSIQSVVNKAYEEYAYLLEDEFVPIEVDDDLEDL